MNSCLGLCILLAFASLTHAKAPDIAAGRAVVLDREGGHCLLCHQIAQLKQGSQGNIAPPLSNAGTRFTRDELRARIANPLAFNPNTVMPAYYLTGHTIDVAPAYQGRTILTAQELDNVVAYLLTLKETDNAQ